MYGDCIVNDFVLVSKQFHQIGVISTVHIHFVVTVDQDIVANDVFELVYHVGAVAQLFVISNIVHFVTVVRGKLNVQLGMLKSFQQLSRQLHHMFEVFLSTDTQLSNQLLVHAVLHARSVSVKSHKFEIQDVDSTLNSPLLTSDHHTHIIWFELCMYVHHQLNHSHA